MSGIIFEIKKGIDGSAAVKFQNEGFSCYFSARIEKGWKIHPKMSSFSSILNDFEDCSILTENQENLIPQEFCCFGHPSWPTTRKTSGLK